jgi:two-component system, response regulator
MDEWQAVEILYAEDSDADAEMTLRAFRKGGLKNKILRVRDGTEALDFLFRDGAFAKRDQLPPKLILLDMKMPKLGGLEVLRRAKSDATTKSIPVVMLTSSSQESDVLESYGLGANSYLVKPVQMAAFTELVIQTGLYWIGINRTPG